MADENMETKDAVTPTADTEKKESPAPSQKERTEIEKAAFSLKKNAERLRELGGDPVDALGIRPHLNIAEEIPDDKPLTIKDLRDIQKMDAHQTALQMADDIDDEVEREKVKTILSERIRPSGNAQADLAIARAAANAERNAKIAEMATTRTSARVTAAGGSRPATTEEEFVPTEAEMVFMRKPYNLSKEKILEMRKKSQQ